MLIDTMKTKNLMPESPYVAMHREVFIDFNHSQVFYFLKGINMGKSNFRRKIGFCFYCNNNAFYRFKNGILCCQKHYTKCPRMRKKLTEQNKGPNWKPRPLDSKAPYCQCTWKCGKRVRWNKQKHTWYTYIAGHNSRGRKQSQKQCEAASERWMGDNNPSKRINVRKKRSESMKGSNNHRYGKKFPEHSKRMSGKNSPNWGKSRPDTSEYMKKNNPMHNPRVIAKVSGEKHWNWQEGNKLYCSVWLDKEYKNDILTRDNNECQNPDCWHTADHLLLERHHINYDKQNCKPKNIIVVCKSCNSRANYNRENWIKLYQNIMTEKYGYKYE